MREGRARSYSATFEREPVERLFFSANYSKRGMKSHYAYCSKTFLLFFSSRTAKATQLLVSRPVAFPIFFPSLQATAKRSGASEKFPVSLSDSVFQRRDRRDLEGEREANPLKTSESRVLSSRVRKDKCMYDTT